MTEKRARALHRAMWRWLAKHPGTPKEAWPGLKIQGPGMFYVHYYSQSFACAWCAMQCLRCPIVKKAGQCVYNDALSLFGKYDDMLHLEDGPDPAEWADVCNRMADAWREI